METKKYKQVPSINRIGERNLNIPDSVIISRGKTRTLERETNNYWNLIKSANRNEKLALIALLSASLVNDEKNVAIETNSLKARRLNALTDEEMEQLMTGEPQPLTDKDEADLQEIVEGHQGRIVKGMEKWL